MGNTFWHPVHELQRMANGWMMPRTRYGNPQGLILRTERGLEVYVRNGEEAIPVGIASSLSEAATAIWRFGREDKWPS